MSAASPVASQVRDAAGAASRSAVQPRHAVGSAPAFAFAAPSADDEIRLNLSDIPRMPAATLDIDGFRPSLLSRLLDLIAPIRADRR